MPSSSQVRLPKQLLLGKALPILTHSGHSLTCSFCAGGFGVAKNLSNWAEKNKDCTVHSDVERVVKDFHRAGKPLGMCCISPVLAAKLLPGCELTVGQDKEGDM